MGTPQTVGLLSRVLAKVPSSLEVLISLPSNATVEVRGTLRWLCKKKTHVGFTHVRIPTVL